jgi:hypothetical protein
LLEVLNKETNRGYELWFYVLEWWRIWSTNQFYLPIECVGIGILFGVHQESKDILMCMPILLA